MFTCWVHVTCWVPVGLYPLLSLPVEYVSPSVSTCWMQPPSVSACWVPICLCLLSSCPLLSLPVGYMPRAPLPVRYGSPPASALLRPCPHLSLLVGCVLFLPPLAGYVSLSIPACWARVPSHLCLINAHLHLSSLWMPASAYGVSPSICLYTLDACLCALGTCLPLSSCVGIRLSLCRPTGRMMGERARGQPSGNGEGGKRGRERGKIVGLELGNHRPQVIGGPELGPAPALTLHIRLGPGHLRGSPGRCLLLPWCLGPAGRMEQDPKPPRLRLWALLPWLPRKQRPRTSQTSLPAPGPGSGPRRDSVSVPRCLVLAWLWPLEQVLGQRVWPQLAFGSPGPGLALLDDWTLPRLASWGSEEALRGSRAIAADWREDRRVPVQLGSGKGVFSRLL